MQIDLSQYIESAEIILFQKKQGVTITSLCNLLDVTPNTSKLILHELANKHKDLVNIVFCVTGIKNGSYSVSLCRSNVLDQTKEEFSLITSIHYYGLIPTEIQSIADGICNSILDSIHSTNSNNSQPHSHIEDPSIHCDESQIRTYVNPSMQVHASPKKELIKTGVSQNSVKSLFANAPKKKPQPKKEVIEVKDEDLFDHESEEEEDQIAVQNRLRHLALHLDSDDETPAKPTVEEEEDKDDDNEEKPTRKSQKRPKVISGAMDQFAKKTAVSKQPACPPGKRLVKKLREVVGQDGFSYIEEYMEEEDIPEEELKKEKEKEIEKEKEKEKEKIDKPVANKKSGKTNNITSFFAKKK